MPGTFAAEDELFALGRAMAAGGRAVFELAPMGAAGEDLVAPKSEIDWMCRLADDHRHAGVVHARCRSTPRPTCGAS